MQTISVCSGHYNTFDNQTCTRCGESFKSDAFVRLIKEWTEFSTHHAPIRDIKDMGVNLEIVEIAEQILSPHQKP